MQSSVLRARRISEAIAWQSGCRKRANGRAKGAAPRSVITCQRRKRGETRDRRLAGAFFSQPETCRPPLHIDAGARHTEPTHICRCAHTQAKVSQPASQADTARTRRGRPAGGRQHARRRNGSLRKSFSKENDCTASQPACTAPNATGETGVAPFVRAAEARKVRTPEWGGTASSCAKRNREQFVHFCIYCADDRIPRPEVAARGSLLFSTASARIGS